MIKNQETPHSKDFNNDRILKKGKKYNIHKENVRSNIFYKKNNFPPIYFYKKASIPYKYNITSVPKYLIKTNEEKRFISKLYNSLTNEKDRNTLKDLLNKSKRKFNLKRDKYKPKYFDVQKLLNYRPNLYEKFSEPLGKNTQILNRNKNNYCEIKKEKSNNFNSCPNNESISIIKEKRDNMNNNFENEFKNEIKINKELTNEEQIRFKYKLSDIFNLRKESIFVNKSAEKHLFKKNNIYSNDALTGKCPNKTYTNNMYKEKEENKFYTTSESKSDWIPNKINNNKMGTNSSVSYNILCPSTFGTNRFITANELNKNNLFNESPAFRKVKSISEFIDLTRVSATNTLGCFGRKIKIPNFRFNNNICTNQLDAYHINRNLIEKHL